MVEQSKTTDSFADSSLKSTFLDSSKLSASIWTDLKNSDSSSFLVKPETVKSNPAIKEMMSAFEIFTTAEAPPEKDFKKAEETFDKLLGSKAEVTLPNGLKITKAGEGTYEIKLPGGGAYNINTIDNTIDSNPKLNETTHKLTTDKDGNVVIKSDSKQWSTTHVVTKDGSYIKKSGDSSDPEAITTEYPAHGEWVKETLNDNDEKDKDISETYDKLDRKKPFKDGSGSAIEFEDNGTREGKIIIKTGDGQTITLEDQILTITQKDGTSKQYEPQDGKTLKKQHQTRSDWFVEFPNGIVANFGHNGAASIQIKNADGSITLANYADRRPRITLQKKR